MKSLILTAILTLAALPAAHAQTAANPVIDTILASYSQRAYTTEPVADTAIDRIVQCGIKAPSARNGQPWHFTIVKDSALCKQAIGTITDGNVIIAISGPQEGGSVDFDCGLATENMFVAAQSLGLGARIYTGPVNAVNTSMKEALGIPAGYRVVALLRVGHVDPTVDAATAATPRKDAADIVNTK